jgi:IS605 OrfB family transposase
MPDLMKVSQAVQIQVMDCNDVLVQAIEQYVKALNFASKFARENDIYSKNALQKKMYYDIRDRFGLKSQMTVNVLGDVAMQYAGEHKSNRKRKWKDGSPRGVHFKSPSMRLNYPRDYGFKGDDFISLNSLEGRITAPVKMGDYQREMLARDGWKVKSAMLCYRKSDDTMFLNVTVESERDQIEINDCDGIVGIDLGMRFLAVTTNTNNETRFHGGGDVKFKRWQYFDTRRSCQRKGTRSAKKKSKKISGRETRFISDTNHCISKDIVERALENYQKPMIVMEDLTGVRKNPRRNSKGKRELNSWSYFELQQFIEYKALARGIPVVYIDPAYTSQACCRCGHVERGNRNKARHWFKCRACGYQSSDDRVASINIRNRGVVSRYIRETRGLVNDPNVAVHDAEAPAMAN